MFKILLKVLQYIYIHDLCVKIIAFLGRIKKRTNLHVKLYKYLTKDQRYIKEFKEGLINSFFIIHKMTWWKC